MTSILEKVNNRKAVINNEYTAEQQIELATQHKNALFKAIDECKEYLENANYIPFTSSFEDGLDFMKEVVEDDAPTDLYTST